LRPRRTLIRLLGRASASGRHRAPVRTSRPASTGPQRRRFSRSQQTRLGTITAATRNIRSSVGSPCPCVSMWCQLSEVVQVIPMLKKLFEPCCGARMISRHLRR
jgi:hypothetical protein